MNYTAKTDSKGIATFEFTAEDGENMATFIYNARSYLESSNTTAKITVTKESTALTAPAKSVYVQAIAKGSSYQITLKDAKGNVLSSKEIIVVFNGQTLKASTNNKGIATVTLKASKAGS